MRNQGLQGKGRAHVQSPIVYERTKVTTYYINATT